jgi:hypothetical protein
MNSSLFIFKFNKGVAIRPIEFIYYFSLSCSANFGAPSKLLSVLLLLFQPPQIRIIGLCQLCVKCDISFVPACT